MASLYIKDRATADEATELARKLGVTKTEVVRRGLRALRNEVGNMPPGNDFLAKLNAYRRAHPLPPKTGRISDKAFFDRLWGEPDE